VTLVDRVARWVRIPRVADVGNVTVMGDTVGRGDMWLAAVVPDGDPIRITRGFSGDKAGQRRVGVALGRAFDACRSRAEDEPPCPPFEDGFGTTWTFALVPALAILAAGGLLAFMGLRVVLAFDPLHRLVVVRRRRWPLQASALAFEPGDLADLTTSVDARGHLWVDAVRGDGTRVALYRSSDAERDVARCRVWHRALLGSGLATPSSERGRR